jgi:hypothetical protein
LKVKTVIWKQRRARAGRVRVWEGSANNRNQRRRMRRLGSDRRASMGREDATLVPTMSVEV